MTTDTQTDEYILPLWLWKYAHLIGGNGETVAGIEKVMGNIDPSAIEQHTRTVYGAKIELLQELHNKRII